MRNECTTIMKQEADIQHILSIIYKGIAKATYSLFSLGLHASFNMLGSSFGSCTENRRPGVL